MFSLEISDGAFALKNTNKNIKKDHLELNIEEL